MSAISTSSFSITFDLTGATKYFVLTDTYNYGSAGIQDSWVKDCFTIIAPNGNAYYANNNFATPDIDRGVTNTISTIAIPTVPLTGAPIPGVYQVIMSTQIVDPVLGTYTVTTTNSYNYTFVTPQISITQTVDCIGATFTSVDTTNYVVDGVIPTVSSVHEIYLPGNPVPITTTNPVYTLTSGMFYNGLQQTVITSTCTWNYPDGSFITATITGSKSIAVDCTYFCAIYCCLRSINSNIKKYKGVNDMLAAEYEAIFAKVMGLVELATLAYSCGKGADVSGYVAQIQALADCTSDCACQDGAPTPVFGLGGGGTGVNVVVDSCNPSVISVTPTGTNPVNYEICFNPTLANKLLNSYNTEVVAGADITVTPSGPTGGVKTFTVASNVVVPNILSFKCTIEYQSVLPLVIVSQNNLQIDGTLFKAPTTITSINYGNPLWANSNNYFQFNDFLITSAGANKRYKVFATLEPVSAVRTLAGAFYTRPRYFDVEILNTQSGTGQVYFRLVSANGSNVGRPVTNQQLIAERYTANIHFLLTTY